MFFVLLHIVVRQKKDFFYVFVIFYKVLHKYNIIKIPLVIPESDVGKNHYL